MTDRSDTPTPRPWEATHFCKEDGTPIETVEDVIATMASSALKMQTPVLYGVIEAKADDYDVICYTGNGPKGFVNAQLIALASNRYVAQQATIDELIKALEEATNSLSDFRAVQQIRQREHRGQFQMSIYKLLKDVEANRALIARAKGET